jgi:hypothetical protein
VTVNYYIRQLRIIVTIFPLCNFIFSFIPVRRYLDYSPWIHRVRSKSFLFVILILFFLATNVISFFFYNHIPQGDAVVSYFQSKIFSSGSLSVPPPRYPEFFLREMVQHDGKWFSMVQPGHSLLLVPFLLIRLEWLSGPLIGVVSLVLFFLLLKNIFNENMAREGVLFLILSPTFLFVSSSFLNQNSSSLFTLLGILFFSLSITTEKDFFPLLSGFFIGLAFFSRTTAALFFLPMIVILCISTKQRKWKTVLLFLFGLIPSLSLQFLSNLYYTGSAFRFAYSLHSESSLHAIGFGIGKGAATYNIPGHTPLKALINLLYNIFVFSLHLFGWPLISLIFIPVVLVRWKKNIWETFSLLVILSAVVFYSLYWFHGISPMGPKYYFEIIPFLVLLSVRGIRRLKIRPYVTILFFFTVFLYIPYGLRVFRGEWGTNPRCVEETKTHSLKDAIVFVRDLPGENEFERTLNRHNYLSVGFRNNPLIGTSPIIFARDLGSVSNSLLLKEYPSRKPYLFEYSPGGTSWDLSEYDIKE